MDQMIFSVYDCKTEAYLRPFFEMTEASAIRAFAAAIQDPDSQFARNAEDFTLWVLGSWDPIGGQVTPTVPKQIATALQYTALNEAN